MLTVLKYSTNFKRGEGPEFGQKAMYTGNSLKAMHVSVDASLKKLRTNYIDLLYIHWWDYSTGVEEVMNGLHNLVVQGKVLYLVSSTYIYAVMYVILIKKFRAYRIPLPGSSLRQILTPDSLARRRS